MHSPECPSPLFLEQAFNNKKNPEGNTCILNDSTYRKKKVTSYHYILRLSPFWQIFMFKIYYYIASMK
jgi:hypothetical protein